MIPGSPRRRPGWRWLALLTVVSAAAAGTVFCLRWPWSPLASARPVPPTPAPAAAAPALLPSLPNVPLDYHERAVAYIGEGKNAVLVTRAELGEYLIPRFGPDKVDRLVKRRILERAARANGVEVLASEVNATLEDHLKGLNIKREEFVHDVLKGYHMNLTEWKEDMIRPRLMLTKLVRNQIRVSEQDLREAFEARYGEQVAVRVIVWPKEEQQTAMAQYAHLRDSEEAFAAAARAQKNSAFAASEGRMKPFRRHNLVDKLVEDWAFKLRPGEVSALFQTADGVLMLKCDERRPADLGVNFEAKREELLKAAIEKKTDEASKQYFAQLLQQANPRSLVFEDPTILTRPDVHILAYIWGNEPITREELGEFLIQRFGEERLELLVNTRIIERACQAAGVVVTDQDVEADLQKKLKAAGVAQAEFVKTYLNPQGKNLFEYKEDVLREQLRLTRLCRNSVHATEQEIQMAYAAHYGEKVDCRIILYPRNEERLAALDYPKLRDSEEAFRDKAKHQASNSLAAKEGRLEPFAKYTTGDHNLEFEAFRLNPGEVSGVVVTDQGPAIIKCDRRIPAQTEIKLDQVRAQLEQEVIERKLPRESRQYFLTLRQRENPRLLIKDPNRPEDLNQLVRESQPQPTIQQVSAQQPR